ncbi:MAG: hypothetical protein OEX02_02550 [Cyclobacteriaceae bacterium]|nr:hypothetical protein [Cyclobacteriaceae bacterium]
MKKKWAIALGVVAGAAITAFALTTKNGRKTRELVATKVHKLAENTKKFIGEKKTHNA